MKTRISIILLALIFNYYSNSQTVLKADLVFDGYEMHDDWLVFIEKNQISYAGPASQFEIKETYDFIELKGKTIMPGLIEGHSHLLLHPYNETTWNDQVLKESPAERVIRRWNHNWAKAISCRSSHCCYRRLWPERIS